VASASAGLPVVVRGGGTSVAGNSIGDGVVLDLSRHFNRVLSVDPESRTAVVQPGVVQAKLQSAAAPLGLLFGPDPSTSSRCTIGGMIGNNACGSRSLAYGRTSDNVQSLRLVTTAGVELSTDSIAKQPMPGELNTLTALRDLVQGDLATIRTEFGRFPRQVSGYAMESLLPENGFNVGRLMVGSEGTLSIVTEATVRLVRQPKHRIMVVLGFPDHIAAAEAVPEVLTFHPTACEGLDSRIVDAVRASKGREAVPGLPPGGGWLLVELARASLTECRTAAHELVARTGRSDAVVVEDRRYVARLWKIRADGAGIAGRSANGRPAHAGWEDAAVPPVALPAYLRDFEALMVEHRLTGMPFGHFGEGCVHIRLDFALDERDGGRRLRDFLLAAAELVARHGGSLSGEHGDGRARSELLPAMYSPRAMQLMAAVKHAWDPENTLNPGILVDPEPVDRRLRIPDAVPIRHQLAFGYADDHGDFSEAVHRCTGVGSCRADYSGRHDVMCPSYVATRDERHSTRGRARVLQEMASGRLDGEWRAAEVHEALDLCLACKGCASDCPTGTDMAMYKSEVLHQSYRRRLRPASHYSLGWLPRWARLSSRAPRLVNALLRSPARRPAMRVAGVDIRRSLPAFARETFTEWFARQPPVEDESAREVVVFVDSFTQHFAPEVGRSAVAVLRAAGFKPILPDANVCCGLTWISTGQLDSARRLVAATVAALAPYAREGAPILVLEPSCGAALHHDAPRLVDSPDTRTVARSVVTLSQLLEQSSWVPPDLQGTDVVVQPHCHHHAVFGFDADLRLLARAGAQVTRLGGCCGLAGNFGMEKGHYEVSVAVAEQQLLPALREAADGAVVLADGFSCRMQIADLAARKSNHLAGLLASSLP